MLSFTENKNNRIRTITFLVILVITLSSTIYISHIYSKLNNKKIETEMFNAGEKYIEKINSNLNEHYSIAKTFSIVYNKNIDDKQNFANAEKIMRNCMIENDKIAMAILSINISNKLDTDSAIKLNSINLIRKKNKIVENDYINKKEKTKFQHKISKLLTKEQTQILNPEIIRINNKYKSVVPIVSSLYSGKYFLGYITIYFDINSQIISDYEEEYDFFVFTESGKLISSNLSKYFLKDNIKKVCSTCIINDNARYSVSSEKNLRTLCFGNKFEKNYEKWTVCVRSDVSKYKADKGILIIWLNGILFIILSSLAYYYVSNRLKHQWKTAKVMVNQLYYGKYSANSFSNLVSQEQRDFDQTISKLDISLQTLSENNLKVLSGQFKDIKTINDFKNQINSSSNKIYSHCEKLDVNLKEKTQNLKHLNKFTENLSSITNVIQNNHSDINVMLDKVAKKLVGMLDLAMGAVFLRQEKENSIWFNQVVSYAYDEKKNNKKRFKLGDSLIGACAAEKRTIYLRKIPKDYLTIVSGLGETPPRSILITPLLLEDQVIGVMELGSLKEIDKKDMDFVERIASDISVVLSLAQNNLKNKGLLKSSENKRELLEEQNKTINDSLNEIHAIQRKTAQNEALLRTKLEATNLSLMMAEYDTQGVLVDANFKFLNTIHYSLEEILEKNISEIVDKSEKGKINKIISSVKVGNFYESNILMLTKKGIKKQIYSSYAPMFDDTGNVINILFFGIEISQTSNKI